MTTASTISTLFGKMARFSRLKRGRQLNHRFLCPNCLHFGGFDFACGECWAELPDYKRGKNYLTCSSCQLSLNSGKDRPRGAQTDWDRKRAYCKRCKWNYWCFYHYKRVHVLATLRHADSQSLYRAISGREAQLQGGRGYVYHDGRRLVYVLDLSDFADEAHSLPPTHALWEAESIWLDASANNPKEFALEVGEVADRFIAQARLTEAKRQAMTVCVLQVEADPVVKSVLETRFGKVRYGVAGAAFLSENAQTEAMVLGEIGQNSTTPDLTGNVENSSWYGRVYGIENNDWYVRWNKAPGRLMSVTGHWRKFDQFRVEQATPLSNFRQHYSEPDRNRNFLSGGACYLFGIDWLLDRRLTA